MLNLLDLFSGIGGFSLGLERTGGFKTVAFCEIEPFQRAVLAKHWPGTPIYEDVKGVTRERLAADGLARVDAICGGFPCQDISIAGKGAGIGGARSGLWSEYARIISEVRPQIVIIENVPALRSRGLDQVLRSLAAIGYDAEWHCIPASAIGAAHRRDRIWIVAHPNTGQRVRSDEALCAGWNASGASCEDTAIPDAASAGCAQQVWPGQAILGAGAREPAGQERGGWHPWLAEPGICRVADGIPKRVDRLKSLGNAVVPQIPELIGRAILRALA